MRSLAHLTLVAVLSFLLLSLFWSMIRTAEAAHLAVPRADGPLAGITVEGPGVGLVGTSLTFTATVSPAEATQPVSYLWEATGQAPFGQVGGLSTTASFTWTEPGSQVITVTAGNGAGAAVQQTYTVLIQQVPLDIAVVFDVSGSTDYETTCFGCWREDPAKDVVDFPFPTNGVTYPAHYDPYEITGTQTLYVPTSSLCTAVVSPTVRGGYSYLAHEAEYYSRNDAVGVPQGWLLNRRSPGQGFWVLQRAGRGSNLAHLRSHPYVTYSQNTVEGYPQLQGMSYNAECFDATGQCWRTRGDALGEVAPAINNTVPFVEYDFTVSWANSSDTTKRDTHIWIRAQGGSANAVEWYGQNPSSFISYRKAIFWKVDNLTTRGGNFNNVLDGPAELTWTDQAGNISFSMNDNNWRWIKLGDQQLANGQHTLRLYQGSTGFNVDKIVITNNPWGAVADAFGNTGDRIGFGSVSAPGYTSIKDTLQLNSGRGPDATEGSATREACNVCNPIFGGQTDGNPIITPAMCSCKKSSTDIGVSSPFYPAGGSGHSCSVVDGPRNILENDLYHDIDPLRSAQEAVQDLARRLDPRFDQVGLVAFSGGSGSIRAPRVKLQCLVYAQKNLGEGEACFNETAGITYTNLIRAVEDHSPHSTTDIPTGMREGLEELGLAINNASVINNLGQCSTNTSTLGDGRSCDRRGGARRILILMTDGSPNVDDSCPAIGLWRGRFGQGNRAYDCSIYYAREAAHHNVTVYTVGIGTGVNAELLMAMAEGRDYNPAPGDDGFYFNSACGLFYRAARPPDLKTVMEDIVLQARNCNPYLALSKNAPAAVLIGEPITYTLTVTNEGLIPLTNLVITDAIPAGATYLNGGDQVEGGVVSWTLGSLAVGEVAQVTFAVTASQSVTNTHYGVSGDGIGVPGLIPVFTEVVPPAPLLTLGKRGPVAALVGQPITYTLTVTNSGTATATNLVITDAIPAGAAYLDGGTKVGEVVSWTLSSLGPGQTIEITFTVTATQAITNSSYRVQAEGGFVAVGDLPIFTLVTPVPEPLLTISKQGPATVVANQPFTYTLTLTNSGIATATNLVITDTIPVGASYLRGGNKIGQIVNWIVPSLKPGATVSVTFVVTATRPVTNSLYGVKADGGYQVGGSTPVVTLVTEVPREQKWLYLPVVVKSAGSQ